MGVVKGSGFFFFNLVSVLILNFIALKFLLLFEIHAIGSFRFLIITFKKLVQQLSMLIVDLKRFFIFLPNNQRGLLLDELIGLHRIAERIHGISELLYLSVILFDHVLDNLWRIFLKRKYVLFAFSFFQLLFMFFYGIDEGLIGEEHIQITLHFKKLNFIIMINRFIFQTSSLFKTISNSHQSIYLNSRIIYYYSHQHAETSRTELQKYEEFLVKHNLSLKKPH